MQRFSNGTVVPVLSRQFHDDVEYEAFCTDTQEKCQFLTAEGAAHWLWIWENIVSERNARAAFLATRVAA